jgi:sec-independent protein translocase protein TatA
MPFGLHLPELIIVLAVALLIFGPKKLPEMGSAIGKSIKEFRKGMNELSEPKDEHVEEAKLPASTTNEMNAATLATDAPGTTTTVNKEVSSSEVKID